MAHLNFLIVFKETERMAYNRNIQILQKHQKSG